MSKNSIVRLTIDEKKPLPLTEEQKRRLNALSSLNDASIDTTDAPYLSEAVWQRLPRRATENENQTGKIKEQVMLRIDTEVLEFFKRTGEQYQSLINAVLRSYVETHSGKL